ncbi:galactose oxidase [Rhizopus microsporus var. microsporus]|uniref:Galactose oxidase n=2 Tax=Rhizopus microsporus TaxID=58291 RepID=A0A1X0RB14_RHIZD|nr:galactose oxidase [Rhizopus microsporus var. microsporus]
MLKYNQITRTTGNNLIGIWRPAFIEHNQSLYAFGGGGHVTDDLRYLDLSTMCWKALHNVQGKPPSRRYGHTATKWKDSVIIVGGCTDNQEYCNDVYIFNLKTQTWHRPTTVGTITNRHLHSAVVFEDKLIVFGGFSKTTDCTYVLDEMCILDLHTMTWTTHHNMPPRYNHSATLVGNKMHIYAGKDEQGTTVSDLFVIHLQNEPYTAYPLICNDQFEDLGMVLAKSQHFCDTTCGKLFVFGRYANRKQLDNNDKNNSSNSISSDNDLIYGLWMLDLDTLQWKKQECSKHFEVGGWNYFIVIREPLNDKIESPRPQVFCNSLLFLGNTDSSKSHGHDHFRDALTINCESFGLYDLGEPRLPTTELLKLLNTPEHSDFLIRTGDGKEIYVHQVILLSRWPHFKNMCTSGMFESVTKIIVIPEPFDVVMAFLKYIYGDTLDDSEPWQVLCELLLLANLYQLHRLKKLCCQRLYTHHMSIESCGYIFEKAIMTDEIGLKWLTLKFMFQNYGSFIKSNIFNQLSAIVQEEFVKAVPDEAVLEVGRAGYVATKSMSCDRRQTFVIEYPVETHTSLVSVGDSSLSLRI